MIILCIMWQLHFSRFLKHVFLKALEIRCLLICSKYVRKYDTVCVFDPHFWITFLWCVCITYWNNVTATFRFRFLLRRNFFTSQLCYLFFQIVSLSDDVKITLNYENWWNVWILCGNYLIKWSYFSYLIF